MILIEEEIFKKVGEGRIQRTDNFIVFPPPLQYERIEEKIGVHVSALADLVANI